MPNNSNYHLESICDDYVVCNSYFIEPASLSTSPESIPELLTPIPGYSGNLPFIDGS